MKAEKAYIEYTGTIPNSGQTVTLFDSTISIYSDLRNNEFYWYLFSIKGSANADNRLTAQFSVDKGITWHTFQDCTDVDFTQTVPVEFGEVCIAMYKDVRIRFTSGTSGQSVFIVNQVLSQQKAFSL